MIDQNNENIGFSSEKWFGLTQIGMNKRANIENSFDYE
jgi:hypothetical protein